MAGKPILRVLSWSGGADSTASLILDHMLHPGYDEEKIQLVVLSEVMFDRNYFEEGVGISAESPEQLRFIAAAKEVFEGWGYPVQIIRHETKDYMTHFNHIIGRSSGTQGYAAGFPLAKACALQRDLKVRVVERYLRDLSRENEIYSCIGYTANEKSRLESMRTNNEKGIGYHCYSLLAENGYTHEDAMRLCEQHGLLSPVYKNIDPSTPDRKIRSGCWCCPWAKVSEQAHLVKETCHGAEVFQKFVELENRTDIAYKNWNYKTHETLKERAKKVIQFIDDYL